MAGTTFMVLHRPQFSWVGVPNSSHRVEGCEPSLEEKIDFYVKTLASIVGSEEEAKRKIYTVGGRLMRYTGFRAVMSEEMAYELECLELALCLSTVTSCRRRLSGFRGHLLVDGKVVLRPTSFSMKRLEVGKLSGLLHFM
ncbi:hypothetical protein ERO13_D03G119732v2 [Gossypium hirsutum]|nr:hypothetical protein ERO13_D03G119732v2 [Gossypium hirsutum]